MVDGKRPKEKIEKNNNIKSNFIPGQIDRTETPTI